MYDLVIRYMKADYFSTMSENYYKIEFFSLLLNLCFAINNNNVKCNNISEKKNKFFKLIKKKRKGKVKFKTFKKWVLLSTGSVFFEKKFSSVNLKVWCRCLGRLSQEGRRPLGGVTSVGIFLRAPSPYLREFRRKPREFEGHYIL